MRWNTMFITAVCVIFVFVFAFKICLPHRSVTSFLIGAPPLKKNPGSAFDLSMKRGQPCFFAVVLVKDNFNHLMAIVGSLKGLIYRTWLL